MAKITIGDILSGYASTAALNTIFQAIEDELNSKVLYRDNPVGEPNQLESNIDMNSNRIVNLPDAVALTEPITFRQLQNYIAANADSLVASQVETQTAIAGQTVFTLTGITYLPAVNNLAVYRNGARLIAGTDYSETSETVVTMLTAANDGDVFLFTTNDVVTGSAVPASSVTVADAGGNFTAGNVEDVLTEIDAALDAHIADATAAHASSAIEYTPAGTGAVATDVQTKLREFVSVKDFGATGDGVTDDAAAIQAAIDWCIDNQRTLFVPTGVYSISAPLIVGKFSGGAWSYSSLTIIGEKGTWKDEGTYIKSPRIVPTFDDTFAIGIQNGRNTTIKNIVVHGLNTFGIGSGLTSPNYPEMMTNSTFVTGTCRDSRYSPYAGIVIDPFTTATPADGGYPGLTSYYATGAAGSSTVIFEDVKAQNFVIGFAVSPNGATANAEDIFWHKCGSLFNKVGIAICQSQSRDVVWDGGGIAFNLYGVDGNNYGARQGASPKIYNANMSGKYLFNVTSGQGSPLLVEGVHAESFASIGFIGTGAASIKDPATFIGCQFNFASFGGIFPDHHLLAYAPVKFTGCGFSTSALSVKTPLRFIHPTVADSLVFESSWFGLQVEGEFFIAPASANDSYPFVNLKFHECSFADAGGRGAGVQPLSHNLILLQASDNNKITVPYGAIIRFLAESATLLKFNGSTQNSVSLGSVTVTTGANGTATFTVADGTIVRTGDLIYTSTATNYESATAGTVSLSSNCLGIVTAVNTNDITISGVPQSLVSGTFALSKKWWPRFHAASTGDTTTSSTTIANVTPTAAWANGDAIQGSGIPAGAYVVSGGGTATLVISKAATATATGVRLYDANISSITGTAV